MPLSVGRLSERFATGLGADPEVKVAQIPPSLSAQMSSAEADRISADGEGPRVTAVEIGEPVAGKDLEAETGQDATARPRLCENVAASVRNISWKRISNTL